MRNVRTWVLCKSVESSDFGACLSHSSTSSPYSFVFTVLDCSWVALGVRVCEGILGRISSSSSSTKTLLDCEACKVLGCITLHQCPVLDITNDQVVLYYKKWFRDNRCSFYSPVVTEGLISYNRWIILISPNTAQRSCNSGYFPYHSRRSSLLLIWSLVENAPGTYSGLHSYPLSQTRLIEMNFFRDLKRK